MTNARTPLTVLDGGRGSLQGVLAVAEAQARASGRPLGYVPVDPGLVLSGLFASVGSEGECVARYHQAAWKDIATALALEDVMDKEAQALSGGQLVRAAVAVTAAARPGAWVLDRCFEWLDAEQRATVRAFLQAELRKGVAVTEIAARDRWLLDTDQPPVRATLATPVPRASAKPTSRQLGAAMIAEALTVRLPGFTLGPIDMTLAKGERVALTGPNGAGKTTLARAIVGLAEHEGTIRFPGRQRPHGSAVLAFQNPDHQLFRPSVRREIEEAARRLGAFDPRRAADVGDKLGLAGLMEEDPLSLPFPERRLVTIAASLAPSLPLAILDEPTAFLSAAQVGQVVDAARIASGLGTAIIAITHDHDFVPHFADRIAMLRDGRLTAGRAHT